jgi:3-carboxy-cis,cis-muconate cycloisomerase
MGLLMSAHESSRAMAMMLSCLDVNTRRMRANLDAVRAGMPSKAADQWFNTAHAQYAGELARSQVATMRARMAVNSEN